MPSLSLFPLSFSSSSYFLSFSKRKSNFPPCSYFSLYPQTRLGPMCTAHSLFSTFILSIFHHQLLLSATHGDVVLSHDQWHGFRRLLSGANLRTLCEVLVDAVVVVANDENADLEARKKVEVYFSAYPFFPPLSLPDKPHSSTQHTKVLPGREHIDCILIALVPSTRQFSFLPLT